MSLGVPENPTDCLIIPHGDSPGLSNFVGPFFTQTHPEWLIFIEDNALDIENLHFRR